MDGRFLRFSLRALTLIALAVSAPAMPAQLVFERLSIHGYLTQGYATTSGPMILGIPNDGTFDYRRAALLVRFKGTPNDAFIVQIANRRLGESIVNDFTPELQLDWAFYERRLGDKTQLRIGKAPIPMGISNETRFVGTVLPFYRVPFGFYQEGGFTSETLNGVVLTHKLNPGAHWMLSGSLFGGEFDYLQTASEPATETSPGGYFVAEARARNVLGAQLWLQTPLTGLRVGAGAARRQDEGPVTDQAGGSGATKDLWGSVDGSFDKLIARAEYRYLQFGNGGTAYRTYYGQLGYRLLETLQLTIQRDVTNIEVPAFGEFARIPYSRDNAIGVAYTFVSNVVGKFEYHDSKGFSNEGAVNYLGDPIHNKYAIASVSVAF